MIHALHGNAGLPADLHPLLQAVGLPFHDWHLWQWLRDHPGAASFPGFADAINRSAGDSPRVLLGYSLGGRLALSALASSPQHWDAAVLLSARPGLTDSSERAARQQSDLTWAGKFRHAPWPDVLAEWNAQPVLAGEVPTKQPDVEAWRNEVSLSFDVWSLALQPDLRPSLATVDCPVLWISGEQDAKFTRLAAEGAQCCRQGEHCAIPRAGHRVHLDQPAETAERIRGFLQRIYG